DAAFTTGDPFERRRYRPGLRPAAPIEQVDDRQRLVNADQRLAVGDDGAPHQRQVGRIGELVAECDQTEFALGSHNFSFTDAFDETLGATAIMDEVGNSADLELMPA